MRGLYFESLDSSMRLESEYCSSFRLGNTLVLVSNNLILLNEHRSPSVASELTRCVSTSWPPSRALDVSPEVELASFLIGIFRLYDRNFKAFFTTALGTEAASISG